MSWFRDLTSKAEAMLDRLDHNAAQALQDPDLLSGSKLLDKAKSVLDPSQQDQQPLVEPSSRVADVPNQNGTQENSARLPSNGYISSGSADLDVPPLEAGSSSIDSALEPANDRDSATLSDSQLVDKHPSYTSPPNSGHKYNAIEEYEQKLVTTNTDSTPQMKKFKLKTSKLRQHSRVRQGSKYADSETSQANGYNSRPVEPVLSPGADDIRASINRSLQEYSLNSTTYSRLSIDTGEPTTYGSHFDDQPNLVKPVSSEYGNNRLNDRLQSSPSFSIDFPESTNPTTDIADQILRQSALRKKSTLNQVLNKLAGAGGHSPPIISDKTKIRLRRAQMRAASHLRRLNYYFKAYPTMKYWMLGYIVLLQLLAIYVLFFYQSSGSSSYLASQVKQQQEEIAESLHSNSESYIPINPNPS